MDGSHHAGFAEAPMMFVSARPVAALAPLLAEGSRFRVRSLRLSPGEATSLQSHLHRSEHWVVVEGTAKVTVNDEVRLISENQSVYIPLGAVHRMENPGKLPMVLIEVQTGSYLGDDAILRYESVYEGA